MAVLVAHRAVRVLCFGAGVLEATLHSSTGAEAEAWGQLQLAQTAECSGPLLQPQQCHSGVLLCRSTVQSG